MNAKVCISWNTKLSACSCTVDSHIIETYSLGLPTLNLPEEQGGIEVHVM